MPEHRLHARCGCASAGSVERLGSGSAGRPFTTSTSTRHFERDRPFAIEHLALDVHLELGTRSIRATATLDVRRVDPEAPEVVLDALGFDLSGVEVDGKVARHAYDGKALRIPMSPRLARARVAVTYKATPRKGLYFLRPDEHYPDRPTQVWSQCQEEDARHWFPCHDSPHVRMTTEIVAHVPSGWRVLSNGALLSSTRPEEGDWTFHWKMSEPHPSYLVTLVAGEFSQIEDTARAGDRAIPLEYVFPRGREDDARRTFAHTPRMIEHFSRLTGVAYPWNKYAQVVVSDFIFGGMENTTATTLYEHVLLDARAAVDMTSDDLVAHELAHQWFGDYVTCRAWYEGWLNEGFATFFEHVWREERLGRDEYDFGLKVDLEAYLGEAHGRYRRPIVCQDYDAALDLFDRHLYEKGGLTLHALRVEVGDALFWRGVHAYLTAHAQSAVETRDLQRAFEDVSGKSLGRFFEQHVHRPGHPELDVELTWEGGVLGAAVKQAQSSADGVPACFDVSLDLDVGDPSGVVRHHLKLTEKQQTFALPAAERPAFVVVDPEARIVGEVRFKAPADMLRAQLAGAPTARGRWLAAQGLSRVDDPLTHEALTRSLGDEHEFWGTRGECAAALAKLHSPEAFAALVKARGTGHPKVRRAVVEALGAFRTSEAVDALRPAALRDESYLVEGEAARALGRTRQTTAFETLVDLLERPSWFDVVRAGAIDGLAALRDDRAIPHLGARTRYGHPPRARRAAVLALARLSGDRKTRETLEALLDDVDPLLRLDVVRALGELGDAKARPALRERLDADLDSRVRRRAREVIRDLGEPRRAAADPVRDDLDRLQGEHQELKARLAKMEARLESLSPKGAPGEDVEEAAMSDDFPVQVEQRGSVAVWTIDRADRANALSRATILALGKLARDVTANDSVRAVVVTGAGDKAFCAGADLKERQGMSENDVRVQVGLYRSELGPLDRCPKPVVAALNGVALGGGLELALMCDLRVAAAHAQLGLPETSLGIIPGAGGTQRLPRIVGEARAKEMILLARRLSAAEALSWGLLNRVTPEGRSVVDDTVEWITPIAEGAPIAQAAALEAIDRSFDASLELGLELERVSYDRTVVSEDRREALTAFAAKRRPVFRGR